MNDFGECSEKWKLETEDVKSIDEFNVIKAEKQAAAWQDAQDGKGMGNIHFKEGNAQEALECYAEGFECLESVRDLSLTDVAPEEARQLRVSLLNNMAACQIKLEDWRACISRTNQVLALEARHPKALYRRGIANRHLGRLSVRTSPAQSAADRCPGAGRYHRSGDGGGTGP